MKKSFGFCFVVSAVVLMPSAGFAMLDWPNKTVAMLSSTYDGADCYYFTLQGVSEADPIKPGDPTFAFARTQYGAKDGYAMLPSCKGIRPHG